MNIESLKLWHWILIGALVGLAVAAVRIHTGVSAPLDTRPGLPLYQFAELASAPPSPSQPVLRNLTIYPPVDGKTFITGERLGSSGFFSAAKYSPFQLNAPVPFRLPRGPNAPSPTFTIRDYLAQTNPTLPYHYVWYASDTAQLLLCTAASTLLIGGLWPLVLRLLIGAGYGRKHPPEPEYDLDRFTRAGDTPAATPPAPRTPEDAARLETLTASLEANLATAASTSATSPSPQQPAPAVATLSNAPYEPEASSDQPEHPKDYKGEFYPVARSGEKTTPPTNFKLSD